MHDRKCPRCPRWRWRHNNQGARPAALLHQVYRIKYADPQLTSKYCNKDFICQCDEFSGFGLFHGEQIRVQGHSGFIKTVVIVPYSGKRRLVVILLLEIVRRFNS